MFVQEYGENGMEENNNLFDDRYFSILNCSRKCKRC